jgi:hypothetical protein
MRLLPRLFIVAALLSFAGCTNVLTAPMTATSAFGVGLAVTVPGSCLVTCDPIPPDIRTVGLVVISNSGTATAYLQACADPVPTLEEQQDVGGTWVHVGPSPCPIPPMAIPLAPGAVIRVNHLFAPGTRRLRVTVAASADFVNAAAASSASFLVVQ